MLLELGVLSKTKKKFKFLIFENFTGQTVKIACHICFYVINALCRRRKKYSCNYTFIELFKNQFIEQPRLPRVYLTFLHGLFFISPVWMLSTVGGCESQGNYPISHNIRIIPAGINDQKGTARNLQKEFLA